MQPIGRHQMQGFCVNLLCKPVRVTDASLGLMEEKTKQKDIIILGL